MKLKITVSDNDGHSNPVQKIFEKEVILELNHETTPLTVSNTESAHGSTRTLQLRYQVACASDSYGPACSVHCVDSSGHYMCNQIDGSRICMSDYYGPDCSVYCVPRDDFSGHYTCNTTDGSKVCLSGFGGENCTLAETTGVGQDSQGNSNCQSLWTMLLIFIRCFSLLQITIAFHSSF